MNQKHYLIKGTLLLTIMGGLTRIAGFFYKIFLSRTIGASEIGRYQLAIPVFTFCTALCGGGIQTAISRFVAEHTANGDVRGAKRTLCAGLIWSVPLSILCSVILYLNSALIASRLLLEESCAGLLRMMAFSLPFSMIHGSFSGYFMGRKNVLPPALAQLIEQMTRILFVVFIYLLFHDGSRQPDAGLMVLGQLTGEAASALYCAGWMLLSQRFSLPGNAPDKIQKTEQNQVPPCRHSDSRHFSAQARLPGSLLRGNKHQTGTSLHTDSRFTSVATSLRKRILKLFTASRQLLSVSFPLGLNRMLMCVLQTIEAALLPQMLQSYGHTSTEALSVYGTLTGMAMPMLLFPTAATSALGMLLLPTISEAHALHRQKQISDTVHAAFLGGMMLGSFCLGAFLLFGQDIGNLLFQSTLAGTCIRQMALVCPLIYINTTMTGILHGLGRSVSLLAWNVTGFALRLAAILLLVPTHGIIGYQCGILLDQLILTICMSYSLHREGLLTVSISGAVTRSLLPTILGGCAACLFTASVRTFLPSYVLLFAGAILYCIGYLLAAWGLQVRYPDASIRSS